jgi:hypothetical protein
MKEISLKEVQSAFQKTIMWTDNRAKGGKSGKLHVVNVVYFHKNRKHLLKLGLFQKLFFFKRRWNMPVPSHFAIVNNLSTYKLEFLLV